MEDCEELKTFIGIWTIAILSICYCYLIPARISPGVPRLLSLLPVVTAFFIIPLPISTVHVGEFRFSGRSERRVITLRSNYFGGSPE
ncbi:putative long-chain-alcohol O-fatty-acyltransferase [Helianthus annuus]|nr:putative long-chain-alcohol O-fatty-acyltransferase [Helianthus annuus]